MRPGYGRGHDSYPRLAERAITFAIAEADEDLAVDRLAFLAHGERAVLDQAIDACLARGDRGLRTAGERSAFWSGSATPTSDLPSPAQSVRPRNSPGPELFVKS